MSDSDFIWRFTPSRTQPQLLEDIFVQRHGLLDDILEKAAESVTTGNRHHLLLVGPRGIGKTHLISLLHHRIEQDASLAPRVRIAWLLEDETVTSFAQLLKRIYELLAEQHPDEFPWEWLKNLLGRPTEQIQRELETCLVAAFADKTLLLLIENLDLIFEGLGATGQKQWRSFLQEHPIACIVASTQRLFAPVQKRTEPFFGFFAPIHLKPLKVQDATDLLERIAATRQQQDLVAFLNTPEGRSRVRALHHLAGGNHRIYIVLSSFITRESLDQLVQPFEKMADELTPYYQERMRWLSPQQRQIVEYLCSQESPVMPKDIAHNLMAAENTISSQLKKLLEYGYVLRNPRGRESLYELAEPLMRLASEVKDKRRKPLRMLVDFLRVWYRPDQLPEMLVKAGSESLKLHLSAAIERSQSSPDPRLKLLQEEIDSARAEGRIQELVEVLEERAAVDGSAENWFAFALHLDEIGRKEEALTFYDKVLEINDKHQDAWNNKGNKLTDLNHYDAATECYEKALEIDSHVAYVWCNKGYLLNKLGRGNEAVEYYNKALELDPQLAMAWNNKGGSLIKLRQHDAAIECFDKALKIDPKFLFAWCNKGESLTSLCRYVAAIECYDKALEIAPSDSVARFGKAETLLAAARWEAGFQELRDAFGVHLNDANSDDASIVHFIHSKSDGPEQLRQHVEMLIGIYAEAGQLTRLGDGVVRSLKTINADMLSEKALALWRDLWLELGSPHVELELPLRIFRVGIEYLIKHDDRVLLDLISTERRILQQALGLEPADSDAM